MDGQISPQPLPWVGLQFREQVLLTHISLPSGSMGCALGFSVLCPSPPVCLCLHLPGGRWLLVGALSDNHNYSGPISMTTSFLPSRPT